ncbi:MAG: IS66 family transposase [Proteobacteria bacterium]|nr:IS66 family transposase [Pseudomonadota bacterium]
METFEAIKTKYSKHSEADLLSVIAKLVSENAHLKTLLFISGRERAAKDPVGMTLMFNEVEASIDEEEAASPADQEPKPDIDSSKDPKKPPRGKRKPLPESLARIRKEIDLAESDKVCSIHNTPLVKIGEDIVEKLEIIPAIVQVLQYVTLKYKCPCCEHGFHSAVRDPDPIPKSFASPSLLAYIATAKFVDGLPLYRQERIFDRLSIELGRTTMARWMIQMGQLALPLAQLMHDDLLASPVINVDETEVQVICEPGRTAHAKSYMWCIARQSEQPIIMFNYEPSRSKNAALGLLDTYSGTIVCDGYKVYNALSIVLGCTIAGCFAHMRRKFWLAEKIAKKEAKKSTEIMASKALAFIKKIYAIEAEIKNEPPDEILRLRQKLSVPLLDAFLQWLKTAETSILPSCPTGKAVSYALGQWDKLIQFTKNGLVPIDNNFVEAHIRPFVIGRNAWLFSFTQKGAHASAVLYSLVETAKANGVDPHDYLHLIFKELPKSPTLEKLEKLLPYNAKEHFTLKPYQPTK